MDWDSPSSMADNKLNTDRTATETAALRWGDVPRAAFMAAMARLHILGKLRLSVTSVPSLPRSYFWTSALGLCCGASPSQACLGAHHPQA